MARLVRGPSRVTGASGYTFIEVLFAARLFELFPGVAIAVSDGGGDPVRIGSTNLLSFNPLGSSTSGTIYIRGRGGSQLAIRVLGATGRTRVQRYVPRTGQWVDFF